MFTYSVPAQAQTVGYAIVTDRFVLVVDAEYSSSKVMDLWEILSGPIATLEDALTALARHGMANLPDFVLIELAHAQTESVTIAVRGTAFAELKQGTSRRYTGAQAVTWVEASAQQFDAMRAGIGDTAKTDQRLPLLRGVVRTNELCWGASTAACAAEEKIVEEQSTLGRRERRAQQPSYELTDEQTLLSPRKPGAEWEIQLEFGQRIAVHNEVIVGRKPAELADHPNATRETLVSPKREISATHALLSVRNGTVQVRDLQSTNGTVILPKVGSPVLLTDGASAELEEGDKVDFGDGNVGVCARLTSHVNKASSQTFDPV